MTWWQLPLLATGIFGIRYVMQHYHADRYITRISYGLGVLYCMLTGQWTLILLMGCWWVYITEIESSESKYKEDVIQAAIDAEAGEDSGGTRAE